jgi:hypothetical protein
MCSDCYAACERVGMENLWAMLASAALLLVGLEAPPRADSPPDRFVDYTFLPNALPTTSGMGDTPTSPHFSMNRASRTLSADKSAFSRRLAELRRRLGN